MAERQAGQRPSRAKKGPTDPAVERHTYKGHEIVIPRDDPGSRVIIDGEPFRYANVADGYYLDAYAYDRDESLRAVVERFIDHRESAEDRRAKGGAK